MPSTQPIPKEAIVVTGAAVSPERTATLPAEKGTPRGPEHAATPPAAGQVAESPPRLMMNPAPTGGGGAKLPRGPEPGPPRTAGPEGGEGAWSDRALVLVSGSTTLKRGAINSARAALNALEDGLKAEQALNTKERRCLAKGWRQL